MLPVGITSVYRHYEIVVLLWFMLPYIMQVNFYEHCATHAYRLSLIESVLCLLHCLNLVTKGYPAGKTKPLLSIPKGSAVKQVEEK